ncbi:MAG: hypothetical protein QOD39_2873 [Mycobacterium sp.]|jgi:hypothetical protein|nr:hypothetical protein [Mycobacterium sp.]
MTQRKVPARDLIFQVSDGAASPTWLGVAALKQFVLNPGEQEQATDITTYDSAGNYEELVMQRGASIKAEGSMHKDHLTGVQDTGQARCETLAAAVAYASQGAVRFRYPADTTWKVWPTATFRLGDQGGDNNAVTTWSVTIMRSGASTTAAAP